MVAQLVGNLICNQDDAGSSPAHGSKRKGGEAPKLLSTGFCSLNGVTIMPGGLGGPPGKLNRRHRMKHYIKVGNLFKVFDNPIKFKKMLPLFIRIYGNVQHGPYLGE